MEQAIKDLLELKIYRALIKLLDRTKREELRKYRKERRKRNRENEKGITNVDTN